MEENKCNRGAQSRLPLVGPGDQNLIRKETLAAGRFAPGLQAHSSMRKCWGLGVDYPFLVPERGQGTGQSGRIAEWSEVAEELEFTGSVGLFQRLEKQSAEEGAEDFHGEEEFAATGNPAFVIGRQTAGGNHAMEVGVEVEILSPAMEHREEAGGNTEMLRVGSNGEQGFGGGLEE